MDKKTQCFTTIDEQIDLLKERHLIINNEVSAKNALSIYGYYNIINGYKESYVTKINGKDYYNDGVTFEQIFSLFIFDHNIRNIIMLTMLDLEEHLRSITSYVIAELYSSNHNEYLKKEHYRDRKVKKKRFSRDNILDTLSQELNSDKNPIKYNMDTYGNVPPWVLFKGIFMNTLVNFIRLQKSEPKTRILMKAYDINDELASSENIKNMFTDSLFMFLEYRNLVAHGGRVYNYRPSSDISINSNLLSDLAKFSSLSNELNSSYGLGRFLILLKFFKYTGLYKNISNNINLEITRHISSYPEDFKYIVSSTGLNINEITFYGSKPDVGFKFINFINEDGTLNEQLATALKESAATLPKIY